MTKFQIVLTGIFALAIVVGIGLFALSKSSGTAQSSNLVVWGTVAPEVFNAAYKNSSISGNNLIKISYVQKDAASFDTDFVNALADGVGPDIVILREDMMYKDRDKIFTIPYANYNQGTFDNNFISEGDLFLTSTGVTALPFMVDPMVMYWNKDMFTNNLVAQTPQYWDQMPGLVNTITRKDTGGTVTQSALALGEYDNVTNAKGIISMLLLQAGTPITAHGQDGSVVSVLNNQFNMPVAPSTSAINFYTQFANPTSPTYTWNRSLPSSLTFFLSGDLAMYFGFASEIASIQQKNSNLNFGVTYVPQIRNGARKIVFAHMYGLAIVKQSKQIAGAFTAVSGLTEPAALSAVAAATNLPPVLRSVLANKPTAPYLQVFYNSALLSGSWIDPDSVASSNTFRAMINSIESGTAQTSEALNTADGSLSAELK